MRLSQRSTMTIVAASLLLVSCAGTKDVGGGLWGSLGGVNGVSALVNSFASKLTEDAAASKALGSDGIKAAKNGLYNSVAKMGGYGVEKGTDLLGALKGKKLDAAAVDGIESSLSAAAKDRGLNAEQTAGLTALWEPVAKSLRAGL